MNSKLKRGLAMAGVILLAALYVVTFYFALSDSPNAADWFKASLYATIIIPVLLYVYMMIYKYLKR